MHELFRFTSDPSQCSYLPHERASQEYVFVGQLSKAEYLRLMLGNWRRFGRALFHPVCARCQACRAIRVPIATFQPDRSQRRCRKAIESLVDLVIGEPMVDEERLELYDRYHAFQADAKDWPQHGPKDEASYLSSFVEQPFEVEEWRYYIAGKLIGIGYVDAIERDDLPAAEKDSSGLSAIYFFYDPDYRDLSLGTWNVLRLIEEAQRRQMGYLYLGFFVEGCRSMQYKARFVPNEIRERDGQWRLFRD